MGRRSKDAARSSLNIHVYAFVVHICFRASYLSTAFLRSVFINSIWSQSNENELKFFDPRAAAKKGSYLAL